MAGIVIVGCPFLLGCVVGPIVDLTLLLGKAAADMRSIGIAHGVACLVAVGLIATYSLYLRIFPKESSADTALDGAYLIAFIALLIGYTISIVFTAVIWYIWLATKSL